VLDHVHRPSPEAIRLMGDKAQARQIAMQAGVPAVPGSEVALKDSAEALEVADRIGYPIIVQGRRRRRRPRHADRSGAGRASSRRSTRARPKRAPPFDSSEVYCEKFIENARTSKYRSRRPQRPADPPGERDCSVQRRHQKLLEESPAPLLAADTRAGLRKAALTVRRRSTTSARARSSSSSTAMATSTSSR